MPSINVPDFLIPVVTVDGVSSHLAMRESETVTLCGRPVAGMGAVQGRPCPTCTALLREFTDIDLWMSRAIIAIRCVWLVQQHSKSRCPVCRMSGDGHSSDCPYGVLKTEPWAQGILARFEQGHTPPGLVRNEFGDIGDG